MTTEVFYVGMDNASRLLLKSDGAVQDLSEVTKVAIRFDGTTYSSADFASAFDFVTEATDGILTIQAGLISSITASSIDVQAELILYDPVNTNGIVWGTFTMDMKLLSEE